MIKNKIVTNIWFSVEGGAISEVIEYYQSIFGEDFQAGQIIPLGKTPSGNSEMCETLIFGQKYILLATSKSHHPLNDAMSLMINCENQTEIYKYWDYCTKEGKEAQCGWCIDKYGLRWQVLPDNFGELMSKPNAFETMMKQKKIIIAEY
jgi:predicted 3-demethylubiquinone-9 3-methyltransferase (glyoxalase superfamily)